MSWLNSTAQSSRVLCGHTITHEQFLALRTLSAFNAPVMVMRVTDQLERSDSGGKWSDYKVYNLFYELEKLELVVQNNKVFAGGVGHFWEVTGVVKEELAKQS